MTAVRHEPAECGVGRFGRASDAAVATLVQLDGAKHVIRVCGVAHDSVEADAHRPARMPDLDDVRTDERFQPHAHDARIVLAWRAIAKRHGTQHVTRQRNVGVIWPVLDARRRRRAK